MLFNFCLKDSKPLARNCKYTDWLEFDQEGNNKDRFSLDDAQFMPSSVVVIILGLC